MAARRSILIVEDSDVFARMLRLGLEQEGFEITVAGDGAQALSILGKAKKLPDLVISDVMMPVMDGLELVKQLRANVRYGHLPVMMLSALNARDRVKAGLMAGADDYVTKDTVLSQITQRVKDLLEASGGASEAGTGGALGNTVTVLAAKGGSGKTVLAINLAVLMARQHRDQRSVLVDLNLEFGSAAMMLDLRPERTLRELAELNPAKITDRDLDGILLKHSSGLRVLSLSGKPGESELLPEETVAALLGRLRRTYDNVVVDGRPSFREFMLDLWETSDAMVVACAPEVVSVGVTHQLLQAFAVVGVKPEKVAVALNQVSPTARLKTAQVEKTLGHRVLPIPFGGEKFQDCVDLGKVFAVEHPREPAAVALSLLAEELSRFRART